MVSKEKYLVAVAALALVPVASTWSDTVRLKSGVVYRNVKSVHQAEGLLVIFQNGRTLSVRSDQVAGIELRPVSWQRPTPGTIDTLVEKRVQERLRKIEAARAAKEPYQPVEEKTEAGRAEAGKVETGKAEAGKVEAGKAETKASAGEVAQAANTTNQDGPRRSPSSVARSDGRNLLYRSLVLPGWGQMHAGRTTEGRVVMGGAAGLTALYFLCAANWRRASADYDRALLLGTAALADPNLALPLTVQSRMLGQAAALRMTTWTNRGNITALLFGLLYGYNIYGVMWGKPADAAALRPPFEVAVGGAGGPALSLLFHWRF